MKTTHCSRWISFAVVSYCLLLPSLQLIGREFTSIDGKKIEATIVAVRGTTVVLKRGTKQFTVPANRFSLDDQSYFKEWSEKEMENLIPKLNVDINPGKSNRLDKKDYFDDRKGSFQISIKLVNEEIHYSLKDAKAYLSVIGVDCEDTRKYGIMQKSNFKVVAEPGKTFTWKGEALHYRFDDHPPAFWGVKYYGFVLQIKNANGKVIFEKSSQKKFASHIDKILGLSNAAGFDNKVNSRSQIRIRKN